MKPRVLAAWLVLMTVPVAAQAQNASATPQADWSEAKISVAIERATLEQAVSKVISLLPGKPSYAIHGELPQSRVTLRLTNVAAAEALRIACDAAGLTYRVESAGGKRVIVISPTAQTAAAAAQSWKASQAEWLEAHLQAQTAAAAAQSWKWTGWWPSVEAAPGRAPVAPRFNGDGRLVDLQAKEAPLTEAVGRLAQASGYEILVDEAVPKGIKVTANVHKMPIGEVLALLAGQAHLAYSVTYLPSRREADAAQRAVEDAEGELEAAGQKLNQAKMEAQLALMEAERRVAEARRAVEQAAAERNVAKARFEAGTEGGPEVDAKERALAGAQAALEDAQQMLGTKKRMEDAGELTLSQIDAAQALSRAKRKLEQAEEDAMALARGGQPGVIVVPAPDSPPVIYLVPVPELRVTGP